MDLKEIPNRDQVEDGSGIVSRPWNKWLTDLRAAVNALIAGTFAGGVFERGRSVAMGDWIAVAFNAANFTGTGGTWTVIAANQIALSYQLVGTTMTLRFRVLNTNVAAGSLALQIAVPGGFVGVATAAGVGSVLYNDAGAGNAMGAVLVNGAFVQLFKAPTVNWTATGANNTSVTGSVAFEVE